MPDNNDAIFSKIYEKSLTVSGSYVTTTRTLKISILNVSHEKIGFNEPTLMPAGNIDITGDRISYPELGSSAYLKKPIYLLPQETKEMVYVIPNGALSVSDKERELLLDVYMDSVNGERKRTHYKGTIHVSSSPK
jgi:hypothetical protein